MLFLAYWELNEDTPVEQRMQGAQKIMEKGLYPGKNVTSIRWDYTPSGWGISVFEADAVADINRMFHVWRIAMPGFFKTVKIAPAMPVMEAMPNVIEAMKAMKA